MIYCEKCGENVVGRAQCPNCGPVNGVSDLRLLDDDEDVDCAYEKDDPKHPNYRERFDE